MVCAELRLIVGESLDLEGRIRPHEAMAFGNAARGDTIDLEGDDPSVQKTDDSVQRPDPTQRPGAPSHGLWPGKTAHDLVGNFCNDFRSFSSLYQRGRIEHAVSLDQLIPREAGRA